MEYEWEQEEYRKRPHCTVAREWLKLALKTLATHLGQVEDTEPVRVQFDGKMLSFTVAGNLVVLAAQGESWTSKRRLPQPRCERGASQFLGAGVQPQLSCQHDVAKRASVDRNLVCQ